MIVYVHFWFATKEVVMCLSWIISHFIIVVVWRCFAVWAAKLDSRTRTVAAGNACMCIAYDFRLNITSPPLLSMGYATTL